MVLVPGARACLLLQCLAQWVLLLLELEAWLLQRVRVAAVAVPIAAAWLVTLALVLAPAERVSALDRLLLRLLGRELVGSVGGRWTRQYGATVHCTARCKHSRELGGSDALECAHGLRPEG